MKPTKNVEKARRVPTNGSELGKNSRGNTSAAATPYRKKSYHSMVVPTADAVTARTNILRRMAASGSVAWVCGIMMGSVLHSRPSRSNAGPPAGYHTRGMEYQLTVPAIMRRAATMYANVAVVSCTADGTIHRYHYGDMLRRARQLAVALQRLGVRAGDLVGTMAWNHHH